jgi:hypothetical protein
MSLHPSRWLRPPPKDRPGDVLRWVRRVSLATASLLVAGAALVWLDEDRVIWPVVVAIALVVLNAATMGSAIRRADKRGATADPDEVARMRRRGDRAAAATLAVMLIGVPVAGYAIYGEETAAVLLVAGALFAAIYPRARRSRG